MPTTVATETPMMWKLSHHLPHLLGGVIVSTDGNLRQILWRTDKDDVRPVLASFHPVKVQKDRVKPAEEIA